MAEKSVTKNDAKKANTSPFEDFFTNFNSLSDDIAKWTQNFASQSQKQIPLATVRYYVFPGDQTFTFKEAKFSDFQDLTTLITYADPNKPFAVPTAPLGN